MLKAKRKLPPGIVAKSIELREKLHNEALAAGKRRGLGLTGVYERALQSWLERIGEGDEPIDTPLGQMTPSERHVLVAVLNFLRTAPTAENRFGMHVLSYITEEYGPKS